MSEHNVKVWDRCEKGWADIKSSIHRVSFFVIEVWEDNPWFQYASHHHREKEE